jgi:subtilisin family serine protease
MNDGRTAPDPRPFDPAVLEHQIALVQSSHPDVVVTGVDGVSPRGPDEPFGYLFREGRLLVRPDVADEVQRFLADRRTPATLVARAPLPSDHPVAGRTDVAAVDLDDADAVQGRLPVAFQLTDCEPVRGIPELSRLVAEQIGADDDGFPAASPHHVFFMTPHGPMCPATEPGEVERAEPVYPLMRPAGSGAGSAVAVLDTGFIRSAAGHFHWLGGVSQWDPDRLDVFDVGALTDDPDGFIDPYAGHGTFIAGIIGRIAPAADVHVRRLDIDLRQVFTSWPTYSADIVDELHLPDHIRMALLQGRKVLSVSAGGPTLDDRPPLSFRGIRQLLERDEAVLVAAAGNESSTQPFWPAAFDWVTGVGALDATRTAIADYSNSGGNADVYAPGTDIVNAYACGQYECFQPPDVGTVRHFHGLAKWSGTSFATPVVAGLVAARMAAQGETAPAAVAALLKVADTSHVLPGVGPTLMPEYGDLGI